MSDLRIATQSDDNNRQNYSSAKDAECPYEPRVTHGRTERSRRCYIWGDQKHGLVKLLDTKTFRDS